MENVSGVLENVAFILRPTTIHLRPLLNGKDFIFDCLNSFTHKHFVFQVYIYTWFDFLEDFYPHCALNNTPVSSPCVPAPTWLIPPLGDVRPLYLPYGVERAPKDQIGGVPFPVFEKEQPQRKYVIYLRSLYLSYGALAIILGSHHGCMIPN